MKMVCDSCLDSFEYELEDIVRVAHDHVLFCPSCSAEIKLPEDDLSYDTPVETEIDENIKLEELEEEDETADYRASRSPRNNN
jgi:hypothetical protein